MSIPFPVRFQHIPFPVGFQHITFSGLFSTWSQAADSSVPCLNSTPSEFFES